MAGLQTTATARPTMLTTWLALLLLWSQALAAARSSSRLSDQLIRRYLSNEELVSWLNEYTARCSTISRTYSIGKSALGADLWVLELSDKPGEDEAEPHFKYVGNMHGDEPSGRVLLAQFAEWVCANYQTDDRAVRLVNHMHTHILITMNPDGFAKRRRENGHGVDLNRNFPDPIELKNTPQLLLQPLPNAEPETIAMMKWTLDTHFVASANLHEGAVVANYPFDGFPDLSRQIIPGKGNPTPDDATFQYVAKVYANKHKFMSLSQEFPGGITNGAQWYPVYGGMQDWNYLAGKCMAITLEVSENKWRPERDLPQLWEENQDALIALPLAAALGGIQGRVESAVDATALAATVFVEGIAWNTSSRLPHGYYNRPVAPGQYTLHVTAPGFEPASAVVTVPVDGSGAVKHFSLVPVTNSTSNTAADNISMATGGRKFAIHADAVDAAQRWRLRQNGAVISVIGFVVCVVGAVTVLYVCQRSSTRQPAYNRVISMV